MSGYPTAKPDTLCKRLKRKIGESHCQESVPVVKKWKSTADDGVLLPLDTSTRCDLPFYDCPCEDLAKKLLGCILIREEVIRPEEEEEEEGSTKGKADDGSERYWGRIVETEAYLGGEDKAAHSYNMKRTPRNEAMYMPPGTAYVYSVYGMHCCFNISSRGGGAAVLIRALEPIGGVVTMMQRRGNVKAMKDLCNGPAKLCQAMGINKSCDKLDLMTSRELWVELPEGGGSKEEVEVVVSKRIGVAYAGDEWANKPLRFYLKDSPYISKK